MTQVRGLLLLIAGIIFLEACNNEGCGECFTPPAPFIFEIVDKTSGENVFTNGTYESNQVEVVNVKNGSKVKYTFIDKDSSNLVQVNSIGWKTENVTFSFKIDQKEVFTLQVDAERKNEDCCAFTEYSEIQIGQAEFEQNPATGIYLIRINQY